MVIYGKKYEGERKDSGNSKRKGTCQGILISKVMNGDDLCTTIAVTVLFLSFLCVNVKYVPYR